MSADFIRMISEIHSQRYVMQINNIIAKQIPCGLFYGFAGSRNIAVNVDALKKNVIDMKNSGLNIVVLCVLNDSDKEKMGGGGIPVVTLEEFHSFQLKPPSMFCVLSRLDESFTEFFARFGVNLSSIGNANQFEDMYHSYIQNLPALYETYQIFDEEESQKVFLACIKGRITNQVQDFRFAPEPQYFLEGFLPAEGDIAIDGGTYDGATARDFAMQGAKVYAFEMDAANYQNSLARAEKYGFTVENLGLSNQEGEEFYIRGDTASSKGHGNLVGKFIDLDTYVIRKNLPRVDYIKLDIEGAELDMLHGAAKTISRWKPKMAVSAYHRPEDLWTLASYIKSIRPDYEFKFRHYRIDCTDYTLNDGERSVLKKFGLSYLVPTVCEMVLYCR